VGRKLFLYSIGVILQFDTVEECDASMITAASAVKTVIEDPLFPVLKEDPYKTEPAGQIRSPGLHHDSATPGSVILMKDFVPHTEVSVLFLFSLSGRQNPWSFLRQIFHLRTTLFFLFSLP